MPTSFYVEFKDGYKLKIDDIIEFTPSQIEEVNLIALQWSYQELRDQKYGIDFNNLTESQKTEIVNFKNSIVGTGNSQFLYENKLVRFGEHSLIRIFERVGSKSLPTIIGIIDKIQKMNEVYKGQWKGFPQLSYTLKMIGDIDNFKISISFIPVNQGNRVIKVITVSNINPSELSPTSQHRMEQRIGENPKLSQMLKKIKEQFNKD